MSANLTRQLGSTMQQALMSLGDNRLRTFLSIMGVAIGIAAVMTIGAIGKGGRELVFRELETFGLRSFWIWRSDKDSNPNRIGRTGTGITSSDIQDLQNPNRSCCKTMQGLSPLVHMPDRRALVNVGSRYSSATVQGVGEKYFAINNDDLASGIGFSDADMESRQQVAVIGSEPAQDLFGDPGAGVGKEIRINGIKYRVSGVLKPKSRDFLASIGSVGQGVNNRILLPYTTLQKRLLTENVGTLQGESQSFEEAESTAKEVIAFLQQKHNNRYAYQTENMSKYVKTADNILQGVSLIGLVAAAISLFVGGMGIMNIISTSVLERTREIGLRKALGATPGLIMMQFLMESVLISLIGGIFGIGIGIAVSAVMSWLIKFPLSPSWLALAVALPVSVLVGLLSGYYPARKAAKLHPVMALRYE